MMKPAPKETHLILKQGKGGFLIESNLRHGRGAAAEVIYTVTAYWTPTRFYTGSDRNLAERAFEEAVAHAQLPAR